MSTFSVYAALFLTVVSVAFSFFAGVFVMARRRNIATRISWLIFLLMAILASIQLFRMESLTWGLVNVLVSAELLVVGFAVRCKFKWLTNRWLDIFFGKEKKKA